MQELSTQVIQAARTVWCRPGEGHGLRVIRAQDMFRAVSDVIEAGEAEGVLFSYAR